MERLKESCKCRNDLGNCVSIGGFCSSVPEEYCNMARELASFRDTGLTPDQIREMKETSLTGLEMAQIYAALQKSKKYEEADNEGRLHIIPDIKLHKTLYWIWAGEIMPVNYSGINGGCIDDKGKFRITCKMRTKKERTFTHKRKDIVIKKGDERCFYADDIGKDVFLTREEAETKLANGGYS